MRVYLDCIGIGEMGLRASFGIFRNVRNLLSSIKADKTVDIELVIITDKASERSYENFVSDHRFQPIIINEDISHTSTYLSVLKRKLPSIINHDRNACVYFPRGYYLGKLSIPTIITVHDVIPYYYWKKTRSLKSLFVWNRIKRSVLDCQAVIFVSSTTYNDVRTVLRNTQLEPKSYVSYNSIDIQAPSRLQNGSAEGYFLTFSSPHLHKGYHRVISGYREYRQTGGTNRLSIIGKKQGQENGLAGLEFLDYTSDDELYALYKHSAGFITLSEIEGFGYPPLEAAYFGTPVVLSNIPVFHEILHEYTNAYYVAPDNPQQIADSLHSLEAGSLPADFSAVIQSKYSPQNQKNDFLHILNTLDCKS